jgi:hypothetical protein
MDRRTPVASRNARAIQSRGSGVSLHHVELQAGPIAIDQWIDTVRYESLQIGSTV